MTRRAKLMEELAQQNVGLKADGLSNDNIICPLGIHESTFCRSIGEPKNKLQRKLSEEWKKRPSTCGKLTSGYSGRSTWAR